MNKKKLIFSSVILCIGIIAGLLFLLFGRNSIDTSQTYTVKVTKFDENLSAQLVDGDKVKDLTLEEISNYAGFSYNTPRDVMWISCAEGFDITSYNSDSNELVGLIENVGVWIELLPSYRNTVQVTCNKSQPRSS